MKLPACFHLLAWLTHYSASFLSPMTIPLFFFHPVLCESKNLSFAAAELSGSESFALISSLATKVKAFTLIQMIKEVGELKKKKPEVK